jgi:hypothetical protein
MGGKSGLTATSGGSSGVRQNSILFGGFNVVAMSSLPVKLESFTATLNQNKVNLKWLTSEELNASHFIVQKSTDNKNFSDVGIVFAVGNSNIARNYTFTDDITNQKNGIVYYRLRTVDIDGKFELSLVRVIKPGKQNEMLSLITYPNPASSEVRVTFPSSWQGKAVTIEMYNESGQRIKSMQTASASQTETISIGALSKGIYLVNAKQGVETAQQKIVKN